MNENILSAKLNQFASQFGYEAETLEKQAEEEHKIALGIAEEKRKLSIETSKARAAKEMRYKEYALLQNKTEDLEEQIRLLQIKVAGEKESLNRKMAEAGDFELMEAAANYDIPTLEATIEEEIAEISEHEFRTKYDNLADDSSQEMFRRLHAEMPKNLVENKVDSWNAEYQEIVNQLASANEKAAPF